MFDGLTFGVFTKWHNLIDFSLGRLNIFLFQKQLPPPQGGLKNKPAIIGISYSNAPVIKNGNSKLKNYEQFVHCKTHDYILFKSSKIQFII